MGRISQIKNRIYRIRELLGSGSNAMDTMAETLLTMLPHTPQGGVMAQKFLASVDPTNRHGFTGSAVCQMCGFPNPGRVAENNSRWNAEGSPLQIFRFVHPTASGKRLDLCRRCVAGPKFRGLVPFYSRELGLLKLAKRADLVEVHGLNNHAQWGLKEESNVHKDVRFSQEAMDVFFTWRGIQGYHSSHSRGVVFWPSPWVKQHKAYLGMELELQAAYDTAPKLFEKLRGYWANMERDGSLNDTGYESISNPMGLDRHREFLQTIDRFPGKAAAATVSCGLHVHISRTAVTPMTLARLNAMINNDEWDNMVFDLSRRESSRYAAKQPVHGLTASTGNIPPGRYNQPHGADRYSRLNLLPTKTFEWRMFQAHTCPAVVLASLEAAWYLVETAKHTGTPAKIPTPKDFLEYISLPENRWDTMYLRCYLAAHGWPVFVTHKEALRVELP